MDQNQIRRDEFPDPRPKLDEAAIAEAARQAAVDSQSMAYFVGATALVALIIAVLLSSLGHKAGSAWIAGLITSAFFGAGLFANYWFTRDQAYAEALSIERAHATEDASERKGWATSIAISLFFAVLMGIRSFVMVAERRGAVFDTSAVLLALILLVVIAGGAIIIWYFGRRFGLIRGVSIAYIMVSLGCAVVGFIATLRREPAVVAPPPIVQVPIAPSFPPGMSPVELAGRAHEAAADAKVAGYCVAPGNLSAVKSMIKRHGRRNIAFVMIDATELTPELRSAICEWIGTELPANSVAHETPDRQFIEAVSAPIDHLGALTNRLNLFKVVGTDESLQRIVVRPYLERVQDLAERHDADRQMRTLTRPWDGTSSGHLQQIRESFAAGEIVVVNIRHPNLGRGTDRHAIYRRLKTFGQVHAIIERHPHETLHYVIKHSGDFAKFVKELERGSIVGSVVGVNEPKRTVSVDLWRAQPALKLGDGTEVMLGWSLRDIERADLEDKYGESRVVLIRVESMPIDPAERDFVCHLIRDDKKSFHAFKGYPWYLLVAPIDDIADYMGKLRVLRSVHDPLAKEREITINIDRGAVKQMMKAAAK